MRLTKFVHSCVLIEDSASSVLIDPGIFSWNSGLVEVSLLPKLDTVVVTHKHPDHMGEPFIRALTEKFPEIQWVAPSDAHDELKSFGVDNLTDKSMGLLAVTVGDHAHVEPFGVQVMNLKADWRNSVSIVGDTHDIQETRDVLLLPVQAPWGTTIRAVEVALGLQPKYILPVHDWMWNEEWRQNCYNRFENIFRDTGTTFLRPVDGQPIEIDV